MPPARGPWDPPEPPAAEPVLARARFRVTPADVTAARRTNLRWQYTRPGTLVVPVLLGLALAVVDAAVNPEGDPTRLLFPLLGIPAVSVAVRLLNYALVPVLARRTYRQTRSYQEEWLVELTRSGARARAGELEHFVPWSQYVAWSETDKVILLYHNDALFQFVPRPAVETEAMQVFRGLVAGLKKR